MRFIVFCLMSSFMLGCVATKNSHVVEGEKFSMRIDEQPEIIAVARLDAQTDGTTRGLTEDILGKGLSLAADGIKMLIDIDKKKYTAEYKDGRNELFFYNNISTRGPLDPEGMNFNGVTVLRRVEKQKGMATDTALYAFFELDKSDPLQIVNNSIFRLRLQEFKLNYAKAKVPDRKAWMPWTWFNRKKQSINMDIGITINATWYSDNGTFHHNVPIGFFNMTLRDLPLDPVAQQEFLSDPARGPLGRLIDGYSILVPRSSSFIKAGRDNLIPSYGQGLYNIEITVKEASKQSFVVKSVYDNSDDLVDQLRKIK